MKHILYLFVIVTMTIQMSFAQDFPDISLEQSVPACFTSPNPNDGEIRKIDAFMQSCNPGKWKPFSGSPDILLLNENGQQHKGINLATGREYHVKCSNPNSSPCPSNQQIPCNVFDKNYGEGVMYVGNTFKKGKKYFLTMLFQRVLQNLPDGNTDNFLDYAGIKLSNNANNIINQSQFNNDCDRFTFTSLNSFQSIDGQEIWNGAGNSMTTKESVIICFTPKEDYTQLLFFPFESSPTTLNSSDPNNEPQPKTFFFKIFDLQIACCESNKEYLGTENMPYYPPNNIPVSHLPIPAFTEVQNIIKVLPSIGDIIIKSTEKVLLRAGNSVEIRPSNQKGFSVEKGATFQIEIKPCGGCSSIEDCTANFPPYNPQKDPFEYVYLPNTFDPSGGHGAINSRFFPQTSTIYQTPYNASYAKLEIFNSWGDLVFRSEATACGARGIDPFQLSWNGCMNGQAVAPAVFTYQLRLANCNDSRVKAGDITLFAPNSNCNNQIISSDDNMSNSLKSLLPINSTSIEKSILEDNTNTKRIINIFPNPVSDKIFLTNTNQELNNAQATIVDILGKVVKSFNLSYDKNKGLFEIDLHDITAGTYLLIIETQDKFKFPPQKIVKN